MSNLNVQEVKIRHKPDFDFCGLSCRIEEMINEKEVEHIAGLARLKLDGREKEKFQKELSLILDYVDQLKELDVEKVVPTTSGSGTDNVMRKDQAAETNPNRIENMLKQAPHIKDGFVKVGAILNRNG